MNKLAGKNVLITGAGSGIGKLLAEGFSDEGANCILLDIDESSCRAVKQSLEQKECTVDFFTCNIADLKQVKKTAEKVRKDFRHVDILINNAGIVIGKPFAELSLEEMRRTMEVNFWGHVYFTREFLPAMKEQGFGNIVNVASAGGLLGMVNMSDYCASKFADVGFSESLRRELMKEGFKKITVTCVCPYVIDTGMFNGYRPLLLNPMLKPEKVAGKIIRAVKKNKKLVILPGFMVNLMLFMKLLLPVGLFDWILQVFGGSRAMDSFKGRKK